MRALVVIFAIAIPCYVAERLPHISADGIFEDKARLQVDQHATVEAPLARSVSKARVTATVNGAALVDVNRILAADKVQPVLKEGSVKAVVLDFEETITAKSLWQFLGASFRDDPKNPGPGKKVVFGRDGAAEEAFDKLSDAAKAVYQTPDMLKNYVNPRHFVWNGDAAEAISENVQLAILSAATNEELAEKVFGGQERVDAIRKHFMAMRQRFDGYAGSGSAVNEGRTLSGAPEHERKVWILTDAYASVVAKALVDVGLGGMVEPSQIIGRETGPGFEGKIPHKWYRDENSPREKFPQELANATLDLAYKDKKQIIQFRKLPLMRKLLETEKLTADDVLFVDDRASNTEEIEANRVCKVWLANGRLDSVSNPGQYLHRGGLAEDEWLAMETCVLEADAGKCVHPPPDPKLKKDPTKGFVAGLSDLNWASSLVLVWIVGLLA